MSEDKPREAGDRPSENPGTAKVIRNAMFNSAGWSITVVVSLLATPYIIKKLGIEGYGIYALLTGLVGYYALLDLGLGQGVTRFVARYRALGQAREAAQSINASIAFYLLLGIPASSVLIVFRDTLLQMLNIPVTCWEVARMGLVVCAVGFFFTLLGGVFSAALMGAQRYDVTSKINVTSNVLLTVAIVLALAVGRGLLEVIVLTCLFAIATCGMYMIAVLRVIPEWKLSTGVNLATFKDLFSFSGYLFVSRVSNVFHQYVVRFFLAAIIGPAAVTYYAVSLKLIGAIGGFLTNAFGVLFPFSSELHAQNKGPHLRKAYVSSSKLFGSISIPLLVTLAVFAHPVLHVWVGASFADEASVLLALLAVSGLLASLTTVPNHIVMGMGHSKVIAQFSVITLSVLAIATPILTREFGLVGTGISILLGTLPGLVLVVYQTKRILEIRFVDYFRAVLGFHMIAVGIFSVAALLSNIGLFPHPESSLTVGVLLLGIYFSAMHWLGWFSVPRIFKFYKGAQSLESS